MSHHTSRIFGILSFFGIGNGVALAFGHYWEYLSVSIPLNTERIPWIYSIYSPCLSYFCKVRTRFYKSELLGVSEPPIPASFGSLRYQNFKRSSELNVGELALTVVAKLIMASLICWLHAL